MTSVFIVRPFGKKSVTFKDKDNKDATIEVDFDDIDRSLIQKALAANELEGQTTGAIAEAGNIRLDMFQMLIAYDLVIADISIDNANVFYELGIRHGLRPNGTILMRFPTGGKDVPFDLKTDRYVSYDRNNPAASIDLLTKSIKDTLAAARRAERKPDSPVFLLLPALVPTDPARLVVVPTEFQEAVEKAESDKAHATLALLAEEAKLNAWARRGVRMIGRAELRLKSFGAARESWEFIRKSLPDDIDANLKLATIYQRMGDLVLSSQACHRVLENESAEREARADARSQLARNQKALWVANFSTETSEAARRAQAIGDDRLTSAFEGYMDGFAEDLNNYYSGLNAFALLTIIVKLAEMEPGAWVGLFPTKKRADAKLDEYKDQLAYMNGAVRLSLENAGRKAERTEEPDEWLPASEAQYSLLTSDSPTYVKSRYRAATNAGSGGFSVASEAAQVGILQSLGLCPENCKAALEALGIGPSGAAPMAKDAAKESPPRDRVIVVSGHRADAPGRKPARFPNEKTSIELAKNWLRGQITDEKAETKGAVTGIGGAASGTDILFHEVCAELGIPTTIVLPIPNEDYRRQSVADGGPDWVERFNKLIRSRPVVMLSESADLPVWVEVVPNYGVFQRGNIWMMEDALLRPNADVTLLALWNGQAGDGPGGTADMVKLAQQHGAKVCVKNTNELFSLQTSP